MTFRSLSRTAALLLMLSGPALAAGSDTGASSAATQPGYAEARAAIDAGQYAAALRILAPVVKAEPRNADAWNLMGFASRKLKNYTEAARYYDIALRTDPRHVGALEYQGELFVETGAYDKARQNLKLLRSICGTCAEAVDLQAQLAAAGQS